MASSRLILVGRVTGVHGVRGELKIAAFTATPEALLDYRDLRRGDGTPAIKLTSGRPAKAGLVVRAKGVETRDQAEALRGLELYVARDALPTPDDDEFYLTDLIGLEARDTTGAAVGRIRTVENFGAGDLLEIEPVGGGASWWLPFTREAVPDVDIGGGWVVVTAPEATE
jgi:16S rRNA processing protein RimM